MISIEYKKNLDKTFYDKIDTEFEKYAIQNDVICQYESFAFIAKQDDEVIGIIEGHAYYKEVYIENLIVLEKFRHQHVGSALIEAVEKYFQNKGYENINLTTYHFQAPAFYKKCGFEIEHIRENKEDPKLTKYFLIKYFS